MTVMAGRYSGGMIALVPESPGALAVVDGVPVEDLHLTLAYLGPDMSILNDTHRAGLIKVVEEIADPPRPNLDPRYPTRDFAARGPVRARAWAHAMFNPDDESALVYLVEDEPLPDGEMPPPHQQWIEDLHWRAVGRARDVLGALMAEQRRRFQPHVTVAYPPASKTASLTFTGPVVFNRIRLALGGDVRDFPLIAPIEEKRQSNDPRARRLARWWARDPKGRARWRPGSPGDYNRLRAALRAEIGAKMPQRVLDGLAANIHKMATGEWPGPKAHSGRGKKKSVKSVVEPTSLEGKKMTGETDDEMDAKLDRYAAMADDLVEAEFDGEDDNRPDDEDDESDGDRPDGQDFADLVDDKEEKGKGKKSATDDVDSMEKVYSTAVANDPEWELQSDGELVRSDMDNEDGDDLASFARELTSLFGEVASA